MLHLSSSVHVREYEFMRMQPARMIVLQKMAWKTFVCISLALLAWGSAVKAYVPVSKNMRSFSSAIKGGTIGTNEEKVLYEHNTGQPGVITEQWFTGTKVMDENMRIRIYIDGEAEASLDFQLFLAHGIGSTESQEIPNIPWGMKRIAHDADGGIYNTYQIPFSVSFRVTATHPVGGTFWYIIRGVENFPLVMGNLLLPASTRLRLYKNVGVLMKPLTFITLVDVQNTAGAVYQVTLAANSSDYNYLEACMRAKIDGATNTTWLSSGTEDFFLSAYYFDRGIYHTENSGLTFNDHKGAMSAYKFFENDPLLFTKSLQLMWRCGETIDGALGCPSDFPPPGMDGRDTRKPTLNVQLASTNVTTYTWVYEWQYT